MIASNGVLFLALDSLDPDLVEQWAGEGRLPNLRRFYQSAVQGPTRNPAGMVSGSVWTNLLNGVGAGVHGQYDGVTGFDPATYMTGHIGPEATVAVPFWKRLSDAGYRVGVLDAPHSFLQPEVNGFQVVDWITHLRVMDGPTARSTPPGLAAQLIERFGDDPFPRGDRCPTDAFPVGTEAEVRDFVERMRGRVRRKLDGALWLLAENALDLAWITFDAAHDTGHMLWHLHDPQDERYDPALAAACGDPLLEIYQEIDAAVGQLAATVGDDAYMVVYLSHGMGKAITASKTLDTVLRKLEGSYYPEAAEASRPTGWRVMARQAWRKLPPALREPLSRAGDAKRVQIRNQITSRDRAARRFFEIYMYDSAGAVRFNLAGREAEGKVDPGAEYRELLQKVRDDLMALRIVDTGEPAVDKVILADEAHAGPRRDRVPDMLIEWNRSHEIRQITSPRIGVVDNPDHGRRSGDHRFGGYWMISGPGMERQRRNAPVDNAALSHELLRHFGVAAPTGTHLPEAEAGLDVFGRPKVGAG
ncbi:MAG: hypothetical protein GVY28_03085 [Alphaproteobacteria bacterium]|jgi:predicted AlkP superfamily phosphohydrolase/phosphomutase|nr:hypothetical protein [Alphaproteobacteria bacterium]